MRVRNALTRLAAVAPSAAPVLGAGEEDQILARVLAAPRRSTRRRPQTLALVGVVVIGAAAIAASLGLRHSQPSTVRTHRHVALTGAGIEMAGYRFRTPAGFKVSDASCSAGPSGSGKPATVMNGFVAAASAEGGCVEATFLVPGSSDPGAATATPAGDPVDVGTYQGYFQNQGSSGDALYVELPKADGQGRPVYLVLFSQGLTKDQLIAVAQSGLHGLPFDPTTTTGTEATG